MEKIFMTTKEADRLRLFKNHAEKLISLKEISYLLCISYRQCKRIWSGFKRNGEAAMISKKRNNQNRSLDPQKKEEILSLIREHYYDYGPTLISEKLDKDHRIRVSKETVRQLLIKEGVWKSKKKKKFRVYQRRKRRSCFGELEQIDGSPHAWFEERGPYCTLLLAVDDATGKIQAARFELTESTAGYFRLINTYLESHGRPLSLYTDKHSIFRVNHGENRSKPTQFTRAMREFGIEMISANSPQAKGRIERANGVLQDRLVKELRARGISTIEEANRFLPIYIKEYNQRFGKTPESSFNAHRPLEHNQKLDQILCIKEIRKMSKNLEISYMGKVYQVQAPKRINRLRGTSVNVIEGSNGEVLLEYKGELLEYKLYTQIDNQPKIIDHKELVSSWENRAYGPDLEKTKKSMNF